MPTQKISYNELLDNAANLFRTQGYHNTSIADIASSCNLSKASIYHHTPSKIALAVAVIKKNYEFFNKNIFNIAYQEDKPAAERVKEFTQALDAHFNELKGGCIMGKFAQEIGNSIADIGQILQDHFSAMRKAVKHMLANKCGEAQAQKFADEYICTFQGALMMDQLFANNGAVKAINTKFHNMVSSSTDDSTGSDSTSASVEMTYA